MHISLFVPIFLHALAGAAEISRLKGTMQFTGEAKAGPVYLMVHSDGASGVVSPKTEKGDNDPQTEVLPSGTKFQGYLPAGDYDGQGSFAFDVAFPKGSYSVSAFVQNGGNAVAKCTTTQISGLDVAQSCFPSKGDTVCASASADVADTKALVLVCGAPAQGKRSGGDR